jgi:hypothetical protein
MDPSICYLTILEAIREHDYARAREYALILQGWIDSGGFLPNGFDPGEVQSTIADLLCPACEPGALERPFLSLQCMHCDAGDDVSSLTDAIDDGWTSIESTVRDSTWTSHLGLCPDCRHARDENI